MSTNIDFDAVISLGSDRSDIKGETHKLRSMAREEMALLFKINCVCHYNYICRESMLQYAQLRKTFHL